MTRENKSFRKFATKHLAGVIERRRKTAKGRKEMKERVEKKKVREAKLAKREDKEHADDVAKLQETDPEFFSFLETEDPTLLEYGRVGLEGDEASDNEFFDDEDDAELTAAGSGAAKAPRSSDRKRRRGAAAAEDDGLDEISDSDTDVDFDDEQGEDEDDDDEDGGLDLDAADDGDELADQVEKAERTQRAREEAAANAKIGTRISAAELAEVQRSKNMQDAVNLFVCAAKELHVRDLRVTTARPEEAKLLGRKFESPELVKECLYMVSRLVASGAAAALISHNNTGAAAAGAGAAADGASKKGSKKKNKNKNNKGDDTAQQQETGLFIHSRARAIVGRYITTAAAVLSDAASSDESLAAVIAHSLRAFIRVMHTIRGATKRVLRACFALCTANLETARSAGFMVILAVAKRAAGTHSLYQSSLFKGLFLTLIRAVQQYTARAMPKVGFLLNAMVELYGTDLEAAYQHAFTYIRQLAVYLRAALQDPSQASNLRTVCNWQYLIALRTWAFVVSTYHEQRQLGPLIHPVVQIALGVIDVFASPRMIPLHLHVVETLNHVAARARVFIPVAPYLMRIVTAPAHALTSSGGGGGGGKSGKDKKDTYAGEASSFTDLQFMLRVKKAYARSSEYIQNVWLETLYRLTEHLSHLATFISFPEATWQILTTLNKLRREVKVPKISALISNIARNIDATITAIRQKRDRATFGPCDVPQVQMFEAELLSKGTPMSAYYNKQRNARMADFAAKQKALLGVDGAGAGSKKAAATKKVSEDGATAAATDKSKKKRRTVDDHEIAFDDDEGNLSDVEMVVSDDDDDDEGFAGGADADEGMEEEAVAKLPAAVKRAGIRRRR